MRRTSLAALLAAPVLLAFPGFTTANPPNQCFAPFGGGGICLGCFSKMHQHGPLFNYGPYYGYPPFEPYGPWNAYLQYNPWYYGQQGGGYGHGHGHAPKDLAGHGGICGGGWHSSWGHGGWFHGSGCASCGGTTLFKGHGTPCSSCGTAALESTVGMTQSSDPASRLTGTGSPANSTVFYAGLPTIDSNLTLVGGIVR